MKPFILAKLAIGLICLSLTAPILAQDPAQQTAPQPARGKVEPSADDQAQTQAEVLAARQAAVEAARRANPAYWLQQAGTAYQAKDYAAVEAACQELVKLRPYVGEYGYLLAKSYALQNKRSEAYDKLIKLSEQGLTFDLAADPDMQSLRNFPVYDYVVEQFTTNKGPHGTATPAVTLSQRDLLLDAVAWDAKAEQLLLGSIREGKVFRVAADGQLSSLIEANADNGLYGVLDIAVDAERGWLWVASGGVPQFTGYAAANAGRTGIFKFDLASGKLLKRHLLVPDGNSHLLSSLTIAPNGDLYVADALSPMIYQLSHDSSQLTLFAVAPSLTSLRDLVVDPSGRQLFVADYEQGLFRFDLSDNKLYPFGTETPINLGGIDGLAWYKDGIVAIQNGNAPERVMRIALDRTGTRIAHAQPMLAGLEAFVSPSTGVQVGKELYLLAANESRFYHPRSGQLLAKDQLRDPVVLKANLEQGWMPRMAPPAAARHPNPGKPPSNMVEIDPK